LLRVLINLLDPDDKEHTDSTRLIALSVLNTVFEVSGHQIVSFSPLKTMVRDRGCKFLFLLARSENPSILYSSLRAISAMLETMRSDLKLQQELFISFTLDRLAPPPMPARLVSGSNSKGVSYSPNIPPSTVGTPVLSSVQDEAGSETSSMPAARPSALPAKGETRELLLQTLNHLSRSPSFMVDLYVNYDCDINCENISERLITFVTKVC
jgi:brefeldin A-resistance guanine nucleotide exchange factor 1